MIRSRLAMLIGASTLAISLPTSAQPQQAATDVEQVVVTGSRVFNGFDAPTPVTVANIKDLELAAPSSIADGLNQLPQFQNSTSQNQTIAVVGNAPTSGNYLNLRGVGSIRGLILLDGRRVPATSFDGTVDVNMIPQLLVSRVDVVTAGASAVYGSDAISGVVNYVLNDHFEGLKATLQVGETSYQDDRSYRVGLAVGDSFLGGKLHLVGSVELYNSDGIPDANSRPLYSQSYGLAGAGTVANPYHPVPDVRYAGISFGGVPTGALAGFNFISGGQLVPLNSGTAVAFGARQGGDTAPFSIHTLTAALNTKTLYLRAGYDITDDTEAFFQFSYGQSVNSYNCCENFNFGDITIFSGNPYLPTNAQTLLTNAGAASFRMSRMDRDMGPLHIRTDNKSYNLVAGFKGAFSKDWLGGNWTWSAYYQHGDSRLRTQESNDIMWRNFYAAVDAVKDPSGNIVCNVTLTNPALYPGCQPLDLFGSGSPSVAAQKYIMGTSRFKVANGLDQVEGVAQGDLFSLWAGNVSAALGASWRQTSLLETTNSDPTIPIDTTGLRGVGHTTAFLHTTVGTANGNLNVAEGFGEIGVPILRDLQFAKSVDLDAAIRYASYSVGGAATTWKLGLRWQPIQDLTLRAARSHDFRAPTLFDLFAGPNANIFTVTDRQSGVTTIANTSGGGNPNLKPEQGDTTTYGFIYRPSWLDGFGLSVDYYRLKITNVIAALNPQQITDLCFQSGGTDPVCNQIVRSAPNAFPSLIRTGNVNFGFQNTSGIDAEVNYHFNLDEDNSFTARGLVNYLYNDVVNNGLASSIVQSSGYLTGFGGFPKTRATASLNWTNGPYSLFVQERILSSIHRSNLFVFSDDLPAVYYTDITATYTLAGGYQFFGTVNNLFDRAAPLNVSDPGNPGLEYKTAQNLYDVVGRYITVGIRLSF